MTTDEKEAQKFTNFLKDSIYNKTQESTLTDKEQKLNKNEKVLPEVGTKFMVKGHTYKVTYVNKGQKRFSAEPCEGQY